MISNDELLARRIRQREEADGPSVGAFVPFPDPSAPGGFREERIAEDWGEDVGGVQTAPEKWGRFYLGEGYANFSGGLGPALIPTEALADTGGVRQGRFWFFSRDQWRAHNGVDVEAPCRVYLYDEGEPRA